MTFSTILSAFALSTALFSLSIALAARMQFQAATPKQNLRKEAIIGLLASVSCAISLFLLFVLAAEGYFALKNWIEA